MMLFIPLHEQVHVLSILFMRFRGSSSTDASLFLKTFNSLYEIRRRIHTENIRELGYLLSILFMRFPRLVLYVRKKKVLSILFMRFDAG